MLYPLKFMPVYKNYIWGGRSLSRFGKNLPPGEKIAESWEVSAHPNGVSVIANGALAGMNLVETIARYGRDLLGSQLPERDLQKFPLLVKFIDAADNLSVQVHPDDLYAAANENGEYGKNEAWLILDAKPGSRLIAGLKDGTTKDIFARSIADGSCLKYLNAVSVSAGDVINIPAGLVHAIGKGIIICEVQQNSDTTYRVFDYNRRDQNGNLRPLHVDKALDVISFAPGQASPFVPGIIISDPKFPGLQRTLLVLNRYLRIEKLQIHGSADFEADTGRFYILTVLSGNGQLISYTPAAGSGESTETSLAKGETMLLPADMGGYSLTGEMEILRSSPAIFDQDLERLIQDIYNISCTLPEARGLIDSLRDKVAFDPLPENLFSGDDGD